MLEINKNIEVSKMDYFQRRNRRYEKNPMAISEHLENTITKMKNPVDELTGRKAQREGSLNKRSFPV